MTGHFYDQLQTLEETSLSDEERISAAVRPLLFWYEKNARDLPWRNSPTPYRVWISEIMLQQTRVEAVKPYFARFMEALPKVKDLAEVTNVFISSSFVYFSAGYPNSFNMSRYLS